MFIRIATPVLLVLFLVSGVCTSLQAGDDPNLERMKIAMEVEAREPAETVADLPAPPDSEAVSLAGLPKDALETLTMIYQLKEGDPLFFSTATPGVIQTFYADELANRGYSCHLMLDEEGKPISPAFTYGCGKGAIRVMAADDAVPGKTLVAVIVTAP